MDEEEIDMIGAERIETVGKAARHILRREIVRCDLGGEEDRVALDPGAGDGAPDLALVAIGLGRVDMAIAELERIFHRAFALRAVELPGAEAERWDLGPLDRDEDHAASAERGNGGHSGPKGGARATVERAREPSGGSPRSA